MNKAPLTATAADQTRRVGQPNPTLTLLYTGFVNGEDASVLDTAPTASTTADVNSPAGIYDITVSGGSDNNYALSYVEGTLTVTARDIPLIAWPNPAAITYGTPLGAAQLNATASFGGQAVAGIFSYSPAARALLNVGNGQVLEVTFTPDDTVNYASVTAQAQIDVAKAPLTITAEDKTMVEGEVLPTLTARYSGFVNGDDASDLDTLVTLSTTATSSSPAGAYDIVASGAADANYTIAFVKGTLAVQAIGPSLSTLSGERGKPGSYFVFTAQGFVPGEDVDITIDGRKVLRLKADASGTLTFVLFFGPNAPARSYSITASSVAQALQLTAAARQAQTQVTIDPAAQALPRPNDPSLPQANALPTIYIPMVIR